MPPPFNTFLHPPTPCHPPPPPLYTKRAHCSNYGESYVPLDYITGNFAADEEDFNTRMAGRMGSGKAKKV